MRILNAIQAWADKQVARHLNEHLLRVQFPELFKHERRNPLVWW